jgi:transposase
MPTRPKIAGRQRRVYALIGTLPFSGAHTAHFSFDLTQGVFEGHVRAWVLRRRATRTAAGRPCATSSQTGGTRCFTPSPSLSVGALSLNRAGSDRDREAGMICPGGSRGSVDAPSEEVPARAVGARRPFESNRPIAHVARDLGVPSETPRKSVRRVEADEGLRPDLPTSDEREEIKALRKEVYELRRANEILKAASVFFATELDADRTK